jgi:membrane protease subunit HflK
MTNGRFDETVIELPDLGKQFRRIQRGLPWGWILGALVLLILLFNTFYVIEPEEVGVILHFGRFIGPPTQPGLHAKIPLVEQVLKVPVQRQLKEEFGFRTAEAGIRTRYSKEDFSKESLMITGDLNLADVEWSVQYRIEDPEKFLFRVRNVQSTFRDMSESVMREVVGDRTINEVVTFGRVELAGVVQKDLQDLCKQYQTGIHVDRVVLQNVFPPDPVRPSFNEVIPRARGEAEQKIRQAEGYALDRVNRARGDAARFTSLYGAYRKAPGVTRKRMYLETLGKILPRAGRKVVVDEDVSGLLPLLNLDGALAGAGPRRPAAGGEGGQP